MFLNSLGNIFASREANFVFATMFPRVGKQGKIWGNVKSHKCFHINVSYFSQGLSLVVLSFFISLTWSLRSERRSTQRIIGKGKLLEHLFSFPPSRLPSRASILHPLFPNVHHVLPCSLRKLHVGLIRMVNTLKTDIKVSAEEGAPQVNGVSCPNKSANGIFEMTECRSGLNLTPSTTA
jgi:hypothetical protein